MFKCLSLRHRLSVEDPIATDSTNISYIGVYYRCDDLYFSFPRYELPTDSTSYDIPLHYLISTLLIEILDVIEMWARSSSLEILEAEEGRVSKSIWEFIRLAPPSHPGANTLAAIRDKLMKERKRAADQYKYRLPHGHGQAAYFGPEILSGVCEILLNNFSFLHKRPFFIFVDDYSAPKITFPLQESLNRLLMQRSGYCFFKLSTESPVSYTRTDIDGKNYVEGREFKLLNLGLVYLHEEEVGAKLAFLEDVFARRFNAITNYPVRTLEELIGTHANVPHNEVAREIRDGGKPDYWGKETLANLCSGDVHYILSLAGKMVAIVGGTVGLASTANIPRIPAKIQTKAIRAEAGSFLINLRTIHKNGERLVTVVSAFGSVAHSYIKFRNSKNEKGSPPHQGSRIEPYQPLSLRPEADEIYRQLLMYSVFIEDPRGMSRRGMVVPRLYLRRFLIPHFNLTFSTRDSIEMESHEVEQLLMNPIEFEDTHRLRSLFDPEDPNQTDLIN